jgi:nitrate reductase molybdenum cofactor assembly chaperone NarJ/NarW
MTNIFKALSALLSYPTEELRHAASEISAEITAMPAIPGRIRDQLQKLVKEVADGDLYDLQERYVLLFDRTRSLSLHLFEHVHGESRDRGQAMIDLKSLYERYGLMIDGRELPDFLPVFLEFLSMLPLDEARRLLGQTAHIVEALTERLEKRKSPYAPVLSAALDLAAHADFLPEGVVVPEPAEAHDLAALDAEWEEAAVTFGPEAAPSCKDELVARIRAARRPAPGLADVRRAP